MSESAPSSCSVNGNEATPEHGSSSAGSGKWYSPGHSQEGSVLPEITHSFSNDETRPKEPSVSAACLGCRSKHLKCDGQNPCSRCVSSSFECIYVASRRGYKGPRRGIVQNPNKRQATSSPDEGRDVYNSATCPMLLGASPGGALATSAVPLSSPMTSAGLSTSSVYLHEPGMLNQPFYEPYQVASQSRQTTAGFHGYERPAAHTPPVESFPERCLNAFYQFFHGSHPFVVPRKWLNQLTEDGGLDALLAAMRWVGSLYLETTSQSRQWLLDEALRHKLDSRTPRDGFFVQSLMVLIVGLDGCRQQSQAKELLEEAEQYAIGISLNTGTFASLHGRGMPVLEESWRRTWWDLFIIDGMIAGVHRMTHFLLFDVPTDVALPCEEHQFLKGHIPPPAYLEDLEDNEFSDQDREFSSFAYRILCGRNLGKFMRLPPIHGPEDENIDRIETLLTNWRLHLPEAKRHALQRDGQLDEMMFQAHMMVHATSIMLHQPHSQLDSSPARSITSCAPHQDVISGDLFNAHTRHTILSAGEISKLITHRVPLLSHTHFFTCVVTLSSIVHLSKWALCLIPDGDDDLRQQIRLNIGALNKLSDVWGAANKARDQVKGVAQEIYRVKKEQQIRNPHYWMGLTTKDIIEIMATDDAIINQIQDST